MLPLGGGGPIQPPTILKTWKCLQSRMCDAKRHDMLRPTFFDSLKEEPFPVFGKRFFFVYLLKATSKIARSAGLTPEMRPACPTLTGRICASFCRASSFRPGIAA